MYSRMILVLVALLGFSFATNPFEVCEKFRTVNIHDHQFFLETVESTAADIHEYYSFNTDTGSTDNEDLSDGNANKILVRLVKTADGKTNLVVVYDTVEDGSGGTIRSKITHNGVLDGAEFQAQDEPPPAQVDTYTKGEGFFQTLHEWQPCCTDGYAVGPIPDHACFDLTFKDDSEGLHGIRLDPLTGDFKSVVASKKDDDSVTLHICATQICNNVQCEDDECCEQFQNPNEYTGQGYYQFVDYCRYGGLHCIMNTGCGLCRSENAWDYFRPLCNRFRIQHVEQVLIDLIGT